MDTITNTYLTKINDRLDKIAYRRYGSDDHDVVLFVIEQNPGLEREGILLTPGLTIALPDAPQTTTVPVIPQVYLWT